MEEFEEVEPGVFLIFENGFVSEGRVDGDTVTIDGVRYTGLARDPRKWSPGAAGAQTEGRSAIKAPMPGKVVRVLVAVGDRVEAGQGLIVVEAMKMQNELKAPRPGSVSALHVAPQDTVESGALLLTLE